MTRDQKNIVSALLGFANIFHHGDCVGADAEAHEIAKGHGAYVVVHPPDNDKYRAFCKGDVITEPKPYLERNEDIIIMCGLLIATPKSMFEEMRGSGTWYTIRKAKEIKRSIIIVYPNGAVRWHNKPKHVRFVG